MVASAELAKIDAHPSYEEAVPAGLELDGQSYGPFTVQEASGKNGALTSAQWEAGLTALRQSSEDARVNRGYKYD